MSGTAQGVEDFARTPAAAVIAELLRRHEDDPPRPFLARLMGRSPLSKDTQPWYAGAIGELKVARELDKLGPEWLVLHAVPVGTRGSDIDHVLVGPPGIFTINTKLHDGKRIWVGSKRMMVGGHKTNHLRNAQYEADRVAAKFNEQVRPVIALVGAGEITVKEMPENVAVKRSSELGPWLRSLPVTLVEQDLRIMKWAVSSPDNWGRRAPFAPDLMSRYDELHSRVMAAWRVRVGWAIAAVLPGVAMITAVIPWGIGAID